MGRQRGLAHRHRGIEGRAARVNGARALTDDECWGMGF